MSTVDVEGLTVHVQRLPPDQSGPPRPVVVCVHGILTDSLASYYFTLAPTFAAAGFDVVMYDLRGHGRSERPASGYQLERFVADLDALLDRLEVDTPVHLVGNSFGGTVAFGLAALRPDRVASVAYIESEPATAAWAPKMATNLRRAKSQLVRDEALAWITEKYNAHTARLARAAARLLHSTTIAEDIPASQVLDPAQIAAVRCPVLAIYGSKSDLAAQAPWLESTVERSRTVVVADQEHSVLIERTALSRVLLLDWLREQVGMTMTEAPA